MRCVYIVCVKYSIFNGRAHKSASHTFYDLYGIRALPLFECELIKMC